MKKTKFLLIPLFLISYCLNFFSISATTTEDWNNIWDDTEYTSEEMQVITQKELLSYQTYLDYKDMLYNNNISTARLMPVTYTYTIPVNHFVQEKTNWCGPACIRQTLSFHKNKLSASFSLPSQTDIAKKVGVYGNSNGSSSAVMASTLNTYLKNFGVSRTYVSTDINDKTNSLEWVYSTIKNEIVNQTYAPIVLIDTNDPYGIYEYVKDGVKIRHYNTISGVEEVIDSNLEKLLERNVYRVDPHYNQKYSGKFWGKYLSLHSSMSYADSHGSNKVLIY